MEKKIRKPKNWQDFETLCMKLWGEIWDCPEIKKNGSFGQSQKGVDIYGIPSCELNKLTKKKYYGIQCKEKDEHKDKKITRKDVDDEVNEALKFKPELKKFYIATTSSKDAEIEEYIRILNIEHIEKDSFQIEIFFWEDIESLIDESYHTKNFWLKHIDHKLKFEFKPVFGNFKEQDIIRPKFHRYITRTRLVENDDFNIKPFFNDFNSPLDASLGYNSPKVSIKDKTLTDYSYCRFEIVMQNTGSQVIEDWKVNFRISASFDVIYDSLEDINRPLLLPKLHYNKSLFIKENNLNFNPADRSPLIQGDNRFFECFIKPLPEKYKIPIKWELLARDYKDCGEIELLVEPEFSDRIFYFDVNDSKYMEKDKFDFGDFVD